MPDKYVPRETGDVHAQRWLPESPESVKDMIHWLSATGFRCTLSVVDGDEVALEFASSTPNIMVNGGSSGVLYPGSYMVAQDWKFKTMSASDFTKSWVKEES